MSHPTPRPTRTARPTSARARRRGLAPVAVLGSMAVALVAVPTLGGSPQASAAPAARSTTASAASATTSSVASAAARQPGPKREATVHGYGGGVTSVDPYASNIGLKVLKQGGNAVDAAIATAAALGVTEPYSSGLGGGGYFLYYDAKKNKVTAIDGRETAPAGITPTSFDDPGTGKPYPFTPQLVTSGVSVGVPGTPATWQTALEKWGTDSLRTVLAPAEKLARKGFKVDQTFQGQTEQNLERFNTFTSTRDLFLRNGQAPAVGARLKNPDLARTYRLLGRKGMKAFYRGPLANEIAVTVQAPPKSGLTDLPVPVGSMTSADIAGYQALLHKPTSVRYHRATVYGAPPSSSGGTTVGEALDILKTQNLKSLDRTQVLHRYLEAADLAFADRGQYVGDPAFTSVPTSTLLSPTFARERACAINPAAAFSLPVAAGNVASFDGSCATPQTPPAKHAESDTENVNTTNLTVTDKQGNVVEYTLTIEQTGGSGIVVPGRGFLLNNELTDFTYSADGSYDPADPNRIQPLKRPRSSISPTVVTRHGRAVLALGSPGGSTIITTVLQTLVDYFDLGMPISKAVAAPRAAPNNKSPVLAEPAFIDKYGAALAALGHQIQPVGPADTLLGQIGAETAIEFGPGGFLTVVAEPKRRGGGAATVVTPGRPR